MRGSQGRGEKKGSCTSTRIVTTVYDYIIYVINDAIAEAVVVGIHPLIFADRCLHWCGGSGLGI